jgi:phage/plasmid-associated DNA primase
MALKYNKNTQINETVKTYIDFMKTHIIPPKKNKNDSSDITITHTLMGPLAKGVAGCEFKGSYNIEGLDYEKFMKMYKKIVEQNLLDMHIVERPKKVGPMIIDIDFKTDMNNKERQYLDKHIEYIIEKLNKLFIKYLDVNKNLIKAYVFEKPEPTFEPEKKLYKDGFHIIYPEFALDVSQRFYFFDLIKEEISDEDGFGDIPFTNTYDEILDATVINSNGILMYRSHKEGRDPYHLSKIYDHNMDIEKVDKYDDCDLISILSIRRFSEEENINIKKRYRNNEKFMKNFDKIYDKHKTKAQKKKEYIENVNIDDEEKPEKSEKSEKSEKYTKNIPYTTKMGSQSDIDLAKKLTNIFSEKRATVYQEWTNVCWALHSISPTELKSSFIEFSKKSKTNYDKKACEDLWESSYVGDYSMGTLHWWARMDNPNEYAKIIRERVKDLILKAESGTHDDIANVVREMYQHIYKCISTTKNIWYEFQEHKWVAVESGYTLQNKIAEDVVKEFYLLHSYYLTEAALGKEGLDHEDACRKGQKIQKIYDKLKTTGFIENVIKACARKFYDNKFEELLDSKPYLLGFDNGVYDLELGHFRPGIPDDLISMSVGYNYPNAMTRNDPTVKKIEAYFETVQKEVAIREYVLRLLSSFLNGCIRDQHLMVWTGSGCHAADEKVLMYDGTVKNIQEIKLGDNVMGDDGRQRHVSATFIGKNIMVNIQDSNNTSLLKVTTNHRLALRSHFKPYISETYDDVCSKQIYWVHYHENMHCGLVENSTKFYEMELAKEFLNNINQDPNIIKYGEIIPMSVEKYMELDFNIAKSYMLIKSKLVEKDFIKNNKTNKNIKNCVTNYDMIYDVEFKIQIISNSETFYGIEIDGNKKYVMANGFVTYNSNGKSTTIDLVHNALGDYGGVLPTTIITRRQGSSSGATPELADKRGKRFLVIQEPEHDDTVYVSQMKQFTAGNDKIQARALYGNPFYYKPQFKLVLTCNKLPGIPSNDDGTWRRLRVTPWDTQFVDWIPREKHECKKDKNLGEEMKTWGPAFIWLLINVYYPKYKKPENEGGGLQEPIQVTDHTNSYKTDNDIYSEFMNESVEKSTDDDCESVPFLYDMFKKWHSSSYDKQKVPAKKDFVKNLEKAKYVIKKNSIFGIKVLEIDQ